MTGKMCFRYYCDGQSAVIMGKPKTGHVSERKPFSV